jgi:hypothetical protein
MPAELKRGLDLFNSVSFPSDGSAQGSLEDVPLSTEQREGESFDEM